MTTIRPNKGKCKDCPPDAPEQPIIAGRCNTHYWKYRASLKPAKESKPRTPIKKVSETANKAHKAKEIVKTTLNTFFASQLLERPLTCECGCGQSIRFSQAWINRATIAHIVPKREKGGCPSVSTHPMNRVFLDPSCHTNLDNLGDVWLKKKPELLTLMRERYQKFAPEIAESEIKNIPFYLI